MQKSVLTRYLTTLVETMVADYGVAENSLYRAAGIGPLETDRISAADAEALWVAAEQMAADGLLGVRVGGRVRYSNYSTLGHLLVTSKTVGESLRAACDLAFYVGAAGQLSMEEEGGECRIVYAPMKDDWRAAQVRSEAVLLPFARFARWASTGVEPKRVHLMRPQPESAAAFEEAFGAPVMFGSDGHSIVWSSDALKQPMNDANPALNEMLRQHVEAEIPKGEGLADRVQAHLAQALRDESAPLTIAATARFLGLSERSFQRALAQEGAVFRDILGGVRREAAERLLKDSSLPVAEIAARLGYSEAAAFVRAFSRWHGCSPAQWRKI